MDFSVPLTISDNSERFLICLDNGGMCLEYPVEKW